MPNPTPRKDDPRYRRSKVDRSKIDPLAAEKRDRALFEAYIKTREYKILRAIYIIPVLVALLLIAEDTFIPKTKITYTISGKRIGSHREGSESEGGRIVPDNYLMICGRSVPVDGRVFNAAKAGDTAVCEYYAVTKLRALFTVNYPPDRGDGVQLGLIDYSSNVLSMHGVFIFVLLLIPVYGLLVQRDDFIFMLLFARPGFFLYMAGFIGAVLRLLLHHQFIPAC
jgi:hypothetical protein